MLLFPDSAKQQEIKFIFAKSLPYKTRMLLVMVLLILGVAIHLFLNFWAGFIFVTVGRCNKLNKRL